MKKKKQIFKKLSVFLAVFGFTLSTPITLLANQSFQQGHFSNNTPNNWGNHSQAQTPNRHPSHGLNRNEGHFGAPTPNDFHTPMWQRFEAPQYRFTSGPNYRYTLGRPTYAAGWQRPQNTQNERVDAQGSWRPPQMGAFSGEFETSRVNRFFPLSQRNNQRLTNPWETHSANSMTTHDSLGQGANAHHQSGPQVNPNGGGGMLPSTSILN